MNKSLQQILNTHAGWDPLILRFIAGVVFAAHGAQKLFGWFGGYGLQATAGWMESIGLAPGIVMASLAGSAEFFGGLLLIAGLAVRPVALLLAFTMTVAITVVHLPNGLFMANNGYEFGLALLAMSIALTLRGAGSLSFDRLLVAARD